MKTKIFFLSIILILPLANVFAQKESATTFVKAFYDFHRDGAKAFNAAEVEKHKKWLTPELNGLFENELKREKEFLKQNPTDKPHFGDGFPFAPYEECLEEGRNSLKIGAARTKSGRTLVKVKFYQPNACGGSLIDTYQLELVKGEGKWLINDWIYGDGKRLSDDLKRAQY